MRYISERKGEPQWMLDWRLDSYPALAHHDGADVGHACITHRSTLSTHLLLGAQKEPGAEKSLDEVDPELLSTYEKLGIPLKEQELLAGVQGAKWLWMPCSTAFPW